MTTTNAGYVINYLHLGPRTIPQIVEAFLKGTNPDNVTMSRSEVYRTCNYLEKYVDQVVVSHVEMSDGRCVKLLFLRRDVPLIRTGDYGKVLLPFDYLEHEIPRLVQVLSKAKSWKASRLKENQKPVRSRMAIRQHKLSLRKRKE